MKLNIVQTIVALGVSLLISYGLYNFNDSDNKILLSCGSFIFLAITLVITIGANFKLSRTTTNVRFVSGIFFMIALASNILFSFFHFSTPSYIITNGILLLLFILVIYSLYKVKQ